MSNLPIQYSPERPAALARMGHMIEPAGPLTVRAIMRAAVTITALPEVVNLELYQGDDFTLEVNVTDVNGDPFDLDGAVPLSQIRVTPGSEFTAGEFVPEIPDPGGGQILLHLTHETSTQLPERSVWDVQITQAGRVTTLAGGTITLTPEVSR